MTLVLNDISESELSIAYGQCPYSLITTVQHFINRISIRSMHPMGRL